jgi:hypothetical protein
MTDNQLAQLMSLTNDMADLVRTTGDEDLSEIFDQLLVYINKLED